MICPSDLRTLTDFKRNSAALLGVLASSHRPQILTVNGRPKAVLLDLETFECWASLIDRAGALEDIRRGLMDLEAGRTMSLDQFGKSLRERLGIKDGK